MSGGGLTIMGTPKGLQEISGPDLGIEEEAGQRSQSGRAVEDTGVPQRPQRRRFSAEYKLSILEAVDRCSESGEIGALLRREGIYSSLLSKWREQRRLGALGALTDKPAGRPVTRTPESRELERLRRENTQLRHRLEQAELIIDVQKKVSRLLGISTAPPSSDGES
jgi:transposase-like protein